MGKKRKGDGDWYWKHGEVGGEGKLIVNPSALMNCAKRHSGYTREEIMDLAGQVPIYYRSWHQLHKAFQIAATNFRDERNQNHWKKIVDELGELSRMAAAHA